MLVTIAPTAIFINRLDKPRLMSENCLLIIAVKDVVNTTTISDKTCKSSLTLILNKLITWLNTYPKITPAIIDQILQ